MKSKFALRKKCLHKREIFFKKKGSECLKLKDIEVIISEIKSKLKKNEELYGISKYQRKAIEKGGDIYLLTF